MNAQSTTTHTPNSSSNNNNKSPHLITISWILFWVKNLLLTKYFLSLKRACSVRMTASSVNGPCRWIKSSMSLAKILCGLVTVLLGEMMRACGFVMISLATISGGTRRNVPLLPLPPPPPPPPLLLPPFPAVSEMKRMHIEWTICKWRHEWNVETYEERANCNKMR